MDLNSLLVKVKVETIVLVEIEDIINRFSLGILREYTKYRDRQDLLFNDFYNLIDSCSFEEVSKTTLTECDKLISNFNSEVGIKINNIILSSANDLKVRFEYLKYTSIDLSVISLEFNNVLTMIKNQYVVCLKLEVNNFLDELGERARVLGLDYYPMVDNVGNVCSFLPYHEGECINKSIMVYKIDKIKLYLPIVKIDRFNYINLIFDSKILRFYLQQNDHIFDI